jgi:hypothetical protein
MIADGSMERLGRALATILEPLQTWFAPVEIENTFRRFGLNPPPGLTQVHTLAEALSQAVTAVSNLPLRIEDLDNAIEGGDVTRIVEATTALLRAVDDVIQGVRDTARALESLGSGFPDLSPAQRDQLGAFARSFASRVLQRLVVDYLESRVSQVVTALLASGCIEIVEEPGGMGDSLLVPYLRKTLHFDRIIRLVTDPAGLLRDVYKWGASDFDGLALFQGLKTLLARQFGMNAEILAPPGLPAGLEAIDFQLQVNDQVSPPALDVSLRSAVDIDINETTTDGDWQFTLRVLARCAADIDATVRPFFDVTLQTPDQTSDLVLSMQAARPESAEPVLLVGRRDGSRLEARGIGVGVALEAHWNATSGKISVDPVVSLSLTKARLLIDELGIDHTFNVDLRWSPNRGFEFRGGQIGPVTIERINLQGPMAAGEYSGAVYADATVKVGPVSIRLQNAGVRVTYDSSRSGLAGLEVDWTMPTVEVTIDQGDSVGKPLPIDLQHLYLSGNCLALNWRERNVNRWLSRFLSGLSDAMPPVESDFTLRVLFNDPGPEVRLDWAISGAKRTYGLPGFKIVTPDNVQLSLLLGAGEPDLSHAALALTFDGAASELEALSDFAWERDGDREINGEGSDQPLLRLTAKPNKRVSLALIDWDFGSGKLPKFFRQISAPLSPFDFSKVDTLLQPTPYNTRSLQASDWAVTFNVNVPQTLPFLKGGSGAESQFLKIDPSRTRVEIQLAEQQIRVELGLTVRIGSIELLSMIPLEFNWESFAFRVPHDFGLDIIAEQETLEPAEEHLGLRWRLRGKPVELRSGGSTVTRYHFFTLATRDYNYRVQQAPGAVFEIEYTQISEDAIGFSIADFSLAPNGLSLTATVIDRPAKLNGIDTRFRFAGSQLVIKENRITDFTLMGAGPLPPALVGDATAEIALQMAQRDGKLTLVSGAARLKGSKILDCKGTRFQFSIDSIGLKFVYEGKFHLYFTLTGSAQYTLRSGDDKDGALALLGKIKVDLVECPLTGDARVLSKHVSFLVELPKPLSFNFLGAFEMELRGIGFVPQAEVFDGDGAMLVTGQLKFAQGAGDTPDSRTDYHKLYIGLPKTGSIVPRIHFANLPVHLNLGAAFRMNGVVDFVDGALEKGFTGEGSLEIQGLPTFAASFAFLRVRRDDSSPWVRAWFVYIEARKVSFMIPVVQLYIREVGLGFGYRYTLASIRAADEANDVRKLLQELKVLSRTQGDLSKRDRWAIDLEPAGQDPRWTMALRAMISQTSSQKSPLRYDEKAEKNLSCLFLFDTVLALRSDLTFFMAARGWLFANYYDYVTDYKGLREKPLFSGFMLLSPRQKRFLAHVASNPGGQFGNHPPMPDMVQQAISKSQFSATMLVEPGLFHTELGWPNQLRWGGKLGPLDAEYRGGFIFRVSREELVTGISYLARAKLEISAGISLGVVGVRVSALANVAFGGRYIGLLSLKDPLGSSALYAGIGLEVMIRFSIEFWIRLKLGFIKITKTFRFSFTLDFTAGLELGISSSGVGIRGSGHLAVSVMGRRFALSVRFGLNESAVQKALDRTQHVLQQGLEATDVESIPGVTGLAPAASRRLAAGPGRSLAEAPSEGRSEATETVLTFHAPGYTLFVIRGATATDWSHFVLLPAGERPRADGSGYDEEPGFLPAPPPEGSTPQADFLLQLTKTAGENYTLEQYDPMTRAWVNRASPGTSGSVSFGWKTRWEEPIVVGEQHLLGDDGEPTGETRPRPFVLREYLRNAFVVQETENPAGGEPVVELLGDPRPLPGSQKVEDERVRNPTDSAFESAVRGAMEQFRGSPFFRRDPSSEYEQLLERAYRDDTTIYDASGEVPTEPTDMEELQRHQQAHELRGLIVHDMVGDLRDYMAATDKSNPQLVQGSIAFAMGLVFRVQGQPAWLEDLVTGGPTLAQRLRPEAVAPSASDAQPIRTFNIRSADFASNPPRFEQVQQLTDANTIAIAWDLTWPQAPHAEATPGQRDPEHHLIHYHVRRRALDGNDREVVYTVKGADTLHREPGGVLKQLRRRFQIVDHFSEETAEDLAALPASGKSYFYSITPVDFAGNAGRPLSIVATRYPSEPPAVPVDGECIVRYRLDSQTLLPETATPPEAPTLILPAGLRVEWTEPSAPQRGPSIPIASYQLVFRREPILPVGSYGLDSSTQRPAAKSLPTSNARPLPTDIKIPLGVQGTSDARFAELTPFELQQAGVLSAGASPAWRPEAWRVFFQTVSQNGVPSALAPVQLLLRVEPTTVTSLEPTDVLSEQREERRPAELEWLPRPMRFSLLPAEDQQGKVGPAHVPMPRLAFDTDGRPVFSSLRFDPTLGNVEHLRHPAGIRCIRIRWNQGPSGSAAYPLDLNAGYKLLELDVDAHTTETFGSADKLASVLRPIQDVQMIPADELLLTPGDTLAPMQWEAWYPSTAQRRSEPSKRAEGSEISLSPWYSWRESFLRWPSWPGLTSEPGVRDTAFHPALQKVLELLSNPTEDSGLTAYRLELQASPAMQPGDLAAFFKATAPSADPYGWGVLQRFGLSVAFRLRTSDKGDILAGAPLLAAVQEAMDAAGRTLQDLAQHLHVELLFQPGRAVELDRVGVTPESLVALVQLSLRPAVVQQRFYARLALEGRPGDSIDLTVNIAAGGSCSVIDQGSPASGQSELAAEPGQGVAIKRTVRFPIGGRTALLFRAATLPEVGVPLREPLADPAAFEAAFGEYFRYVSTPAPQVVVVTPLANSTTAQREQLVTLLGTANAGLVSLILAVRLEPFGATAEHASYFTVNPTTLATDFVAEGNAKTAWEAFRSYAEALSSTDQAVPDDQKIHVPTTREEIESLIPAFAAWSQRFFDANGAVGKPTSNRTEETLDGPWVVTAYPRAGSPVHAAPDASGRLKYDHLIEDPWAHNYRYYVRPYGRYDLLWQSLRQSTVLFPGTPRLPEPMPAPAAGGLDVVLERTRPVAKPLVLSSTRLDPPSVPASPAAPGPTWEVIVAEHPEQTLIEHNQTLVRQLAFRQVAYTVLRTFAYPSWLEQLGGATTPPQSIELELVEERYPAPPSEYPATAEHLDLSAPLTDADARTLDLPTRIGSFQQGAMALHWEGLPFYYEHRLLLVAQSASTVSPINEVVQRDFEYLTPEPQAMMESVRGDWTPPTPFGGASTGPLSVQSRTLHVPLCRLWDSLSETTQQRWPSEAPDGIHRKPAWLPDLGVVYQLVELFQGNVEVQAEIFFDEATGQFTRRQLGNRFLADLGALTAPADAAGRFSLALLVQQITQQELSRVYGDVDRQRIAQETRGKVAFSGKLFSFVGVMTHADRDNLLAVLDPADARTIEQIHDSWYSEEPVSEAPASIPPHLMGVLDLPTPTGVSLVWEGTMSEAERSALLALPGDAEFVAALDKLSSAVGTRDGVFSVVAPLGPEQIPTTLRSRVTLAVDSVAGQYTELRWTGNLADADAEALTKWPQVRALSAAVTALITAADRKTYAVTVTPPRSLSEELPPALKNRLEPGAAQLGWKGPAPTDAQRAALNALVGDTAFLDARTRLLAQLDETRSVPLGPVVERPTQGSLPADLAVQLQIGAERLAWTMPMPTEAQRAALLGLKGDRAFTTAIRDLLAALNAGGEGSVPLPAFVSRPAQAELPALLRERLLIGADTVQWTAPAPSDAERAALGTLVGDDAFMDALTVLGTRLDADQSVPLAPLARRPRQQELPAWLGGQLEIATTEIRWTGRLHTPDWRTHLQQLQGDAPFLAAIQQILQQLETQVVAVPFTVPVRPSPDALGGLASKLLIGRAVLRYHGLMTRAEVTELQSLYTRTSDQRAVMRLYEATQESGMRGRALRIRTRRGTARPSALIPISTVAI